MASPSPTSGDIPSRSQALSKGLTEKELNPEDDVLPTTIPKEGNQTSVLSDTVFAPEDDEVLYSLASKCETLFIDLGESTKNGLPPNLPKLRTEFQQRFAIWAAQLGVFASPSHCLDTRLRKSPDLHDLTARHLDLLCRCLRRWKEAVSCPPDDEVAQSSLQANLEAIDETLSRLTTLGVTIRQSSTDKVDEGARKLAREEGAKLMRQLCMQAIRAIYSHAHETLQDRLVQSMLEIWGRMKHLQSRSERLSTRRTRPSELVSIPETPRSKTTPNASRRPPATSIPILSEAPLASSAAASDLSSVDHTWIMKRHKPPDQASTNLAKTMSVQMKQGSYPQLPDEHVCKWCLQSTNGMTDTMWRCVRTAVPPRVQLIGPVLSPLLGSWVIAVADETSLDATLTETSDLTFAFGMTATTRNSLTLLLHNGFYTCKTTISAGTESST